MTQPHSPELAPRRVKRIAVEKLFGVYDHTIELNVDERVTIIHGPNGVGKTKLLELVTGLFSGRFTILTRVPFRTLLVDLDDGTQVTVAPSSDSESARGADCLKVTLTCPGQEPRKEVFRIDAWKAESLRFLKRLPWLSRVADDRWLDERTGDFLTVDEIFVNFADELHLYVDEEDRQRPTSSILLDVKDLVHVHLIETQRLLKTVRPNQEVARYRPWNTPPMVSTVQAYAKDLKVKVTEALAAYAGKSQALDQSFPQRLLRQSNVPALAKEDLKLRIEELEQKRGRLKHVGLLDEAADNPLDTAALDGLDATQHRAISLYVLDTQEKLGMLDDLAKRIELLRDTVNSKFRNKSVQFEREHGFRAEGPEQRPLDLDSLSSGEQHELVLIYDLLFRVKRNTLVLIDEPELSLHVTWQKRFLSDLLEIAKTAAFDALVATHSPFIVGDRSDLMVSLAADL